MKAIVAAIGAIGLLAVALASQRQSPQVGNLQVGQSAPNFKLKFLGKNEWFELKSNIGKRPTMLIFGSYT
jgi:hypothetical protein